jgi:hypothetical protein
MNSSLQILLTFVFFAPIALMVAMNLMWMRNPGYEASPGTARPSDPIIVDERIAAMEAANEVDERRAA